MESFQPAESVQSTVSEILQTDSSLYSRQYSLGFRSLRFIPALESSYREYALTQSPRQLRRLLPLAFLLTLLYAAADYYRVPAEVFAELAIPRGIQIATLTVLAIPMYLNRPRLTQLFMIIALIVYAATTAVTNGIVNRASTYSPVTAMLVILTCCYFLAGLRFYQATLTGILISIAYPMSQLMFSFPLPNLVFNCFTIIIFNILGIAGAYTLEYTNRENYLGRQLLSEMALFDGLTGLLNQRAFSLDLEKSCGQARRDGCHLAVAMADVDYFKEYNDHYGHVKGDQCLRKLADALRGTLKRPLDKAGRYGGEEFILVWYDCSADDAARLGEEARDAVESLRIRHGRGAGQRTVTISVGVVSSESLPECNSSSLIRAADRALYHAKAQGRNRVVIDGERQT